MWVIITSKEDPPLSRRKRVVPLTNAERITLEQARDHHPPPYLRERAAALLRVASGQGPYPVAKAGILKPRAPDPVSDWLNRYEQHGMAARYPRPRRQRGVSP